MKRKLLLIGLLLVLLCTGTFSVNADIMDDNEVELNPFHLMREPYPPHPCMRILNVKLNGSVANIQYEAAEIKFEMGQLAAGPKRKIIDIGFDKNGRRVSEKVYFLFTKIYVQHMPESFPDDDRLVDELKYQYNDQGLLIQEETTAGSAPNNHFGYRSSEFNTTQQIKYGYNDKNDIASVEPINKLMKINSRYSYEYDGKGRKTTVLLERAGFPEFWKVVAKKYRYDDAKNGFWAVEEWYGQNRVIESYNTFYKLNAQNQIVEETEYNPDGNIRYKIVYRYDGFGNIIAKSDYRPNIIKPNQLDLTESYFLETDSKGNPTKLFKVDKKYNSKTKKYDPFNVLLAYQEYVYDANGNWTSKKYTVRDWEYQYVKYKDTPKYYIYRTITYF